MLLYNSCLIRLLRSGVSLVVVNTDLLVNNLMLVFRLCVSVSSKGLCCFVFRAFVCSCGSALLWKVSCMGEWLSRDRNK
jgi:hypothetical protein